jgi:hypothetical protein
MILAPGGAVLEVLAQSEFAARKRQILPRHVSLLVQAHLQAFRPRREIRLQQFGPEHHMYLVGTRHADHGQQRADLDLRQCLLVTFSRRRGLQGFAVFHETGRHRPKSEPRLDGAAAQQDLALPFGDATQNQQRVLVVDRVAARAHEARQMVPGGNLEFDGRAAVAAEIQRTSINKILVPGEGIEPTLFSGNRILSPARLPVPPSGHTRSRSIFDSRGDCRS